MAKRLNPLRLEPVHVAVPVGMQVDTHAFHGGYIAGLTNSQSLPRFDIREVPTEEGLVEIFRNACERYNDGELTDAWLRYDLGLIVGWVTRYTRVVRGG